MTEDPYKEYIYKAEPDKEYKEYAWNTAIGLQSVDNLKPSKYLINAAIDNIDGKITIDEAKGLIDSYYESNPNNDTEDRTEEADKVSLRISEILSEKSFSFTPNEFLSIHERLFRGIYKHAGKYRSVNITKKEWVLDGNTVLYGDATELQRTLEYDFSEEKKFSYNNLSINEIIKHIARFISSLWQIHVFGEGNTRTVAVFLIKYLQYLGFSATNDTFATNSWYFRNALVRANYNDLLHGIYRTTEFLEMFLRNLLLGEKNVLSNRTLHISGSFKNFSEIVIEYEKIDIKSKMKSSIPNVKEKTIHHAESLFSKYGNKNIFSRPDVEKLLGLGPSASSKMIKLLLDSEIIQSVKGNGKGKYLFKV